MEIVENNLMIDIIEHFVNVKKVGVTGHPRSLSLSLSLSFTILYDMYSLLCYDAWRYIFPLFMSSGRPPFSLFPLSIYIYVTLWLACDSG